MRNPFSIRFRFSKNQFDNFKEFMRGLHEVDPKNWNDENVKLNIPGMPEYKLIFCEFMFEGDMKTQVLALFNSDFIVSKSKRCNVIMLEKYCGIEQIFIQKWSQHDKHAFIKYINKIDREMNRNTNKNL